VGLKTIHEKGDGCFCDEQQSGPKTLGDTGAGRIAAKGGSVTGGRVRARSSYKVFARVVGNQWVRKVGARRMSEHGRHLLNIVVV